MALRNRWCLASRLGLGLGLSCFIVGTGAHAQSTAAPPSVEKIGDWELICAEIKPKCRLAQSHAAESGGNVLLVTILLQESSKSPVAIVSVPEGVYLAPGIELKVDDGTPFKLLYETCNSAGCHAGYKVEGEIAKALKKGQTAHHRVFDSKQKPVTIAVSLKSFGKALERLQEANR